MLRKSIAAFFAAVCIPLLSWADIREIYHISERDITEEGYVYLKIPLTNYVLPEVTAGDMHYVPVDGIPEGVTPGTASDMELRLGMERKRPFALAGIPAYRMGASGAERLAVLSLTSSEIPAAETAPAGAAFPLAQARTAEATASVLSSGTWHKIAVTERGVYRLDYAFLQTHLGLNGAVSSESIRLAGNGGAMLPEDNAVPRHNDAPDNALMIFDGGDGMFGPGDYLLFYAPGPVAWKRGAGGEKFRQQPHLYEDNSYYFLSVDAGPGIRMGAAEQPSAPANVTVTSFDYYQYHEKDLVHLSKLGKTWVGEEFSVQPGKQSRRQFSFSLPDVAGPVGMTFSFAAQSLISGGVMTLRANGTQYDRVTMTPSTENRPARVHYGFYELPATGQLEVDIEYQPSSSDGRGYLDFLLLNMRRQLRFRQGQLLFRDLESVGEGNVARYELSDAPDALQVWDVTDPVHPVRVRGSVSGGRYIFEREADMLREFVAFDGTTYPVPEYRGRVENQNLHGLAQTDYIIITHPELVQAAERLADFHRRESGLRVTVVTTFDIYNEFSSGSQDISALRDFVKMFYDRAGTDTSEMPRYLLLFGDASYDYKNRVPNNTNLVPAFESRATYLIDSASSNDDFYGFLDANEHIEDYSIVNTLDIGIGRLPVKNSIEANTVVSKIFHYKSPASLGPWRLVNSYVADNEDEAGNHMMDTEVMEATVNRESPFYNDVKVYLDELPFVSLPSGVRCPAANKLINDQVFKGTFMINYAGHGNRRTLAHERILTADDFSRWKNLDKMPFMITATCDFSVFNDPEEVSSGEKLVLKHDGGAIAMLTTTQAVYADPNRQLNQEFLRVQFSQDDRGRWHTFGDALRMGKNKTYINRPSGWIISNFRKFTLFGDPALTPNFPRHFIHTEQVSRMDNAEYADTLGALGGYRISGNVTDVDGRLLEDFNGNLYVTIYDKPREVKLVTKKFGRERNYQIQNNVVYKGRASVRNGKFTFSFVVPKDINYEFGPGKISYYAENGEVDAAGVDSSIVLGGFSDNPYTENDPPVVKPYMNDTLFRDGGITGPNSLLYVTLYDETGINVTGNSVGHDLVAILDGEQDKPYILNDYYETVADDYQRGVVRFPVEGLSEGPHSFLVKAWDVNNNSGVGEVHFIVYGGQVMQLQNLMNYPNPFSDHTNFVFEHNHPEEQLKATIRIYSTSGGLVRTLEERFVPSGSRTNTMTWDGTGNTGARLPAGVYMYRLELSTENKIRETAYQKLIILR